MILHNKEESTKDQNKELIVIFKQEGIFELDFQVTKEKFSEEQIVIQQEINKRFAKNHNEGVFFLGFLKKTDDLSESLTYLRHLIVTFIKKLSMNPDIEILRKKTIVDIEKDEIKTLLDIAPYLTGSEHLNDEWI
ncbi:hypothetical protein [Clostridium sp.]|jgi:hypothetical protein|uniref:hypothetical protein n=1 Tax=Clostridium sp. TaxID=1506 RepID=UPI003EEBD53E